MPYAGQPEKLYSTSFLVIPEQGEPYEDTPENYLRSIRGRKITGYAIKTTTAGRWRECEIYPLWRTTRDVPRADKTKPSTQAQQNLNDRNAKRNFARLVAANFAEGRDLWACVTVCNEFLPMTEAQASRHMTNYLARLRYAFIKNGGSTKDFKYMITQEWKRARDEHKRYLYDADGNHIMRPHWHITIVGTHGMTASFLRSQWQLGRRGHVEPLTPDETGYYGTARYVGKSPRPGRRRYITSTNLTRPQQSVAKCHKMGSKSRIQKITANENDRPAFFEKLYNGDYRFVDCEARYNDVNDGVYLYCRMALKQGRPGDSPKGWGYKALWEQ